MTMPFRPAGCDQQGRYPEAAEAATEVGAEADHAAAAWFWRVYGVLITLLVIAAALFAVYMY